MIQIGVEWFVSDNSDWYPGWTLRAVLFEGPESIPLDELPQVRRGRR